MRKQVFQKWISSALITAMLVSTLSAGTYTKAGSSAARADAEEQEASYAFAADSIQAEEDSSEDARMQITITRSGEIAKPAKMVLLSYDINADYGEDYSLACEGKTLPKADGLTSMYTAFRDNGVVSGYEEDNQAFVDALLSHSGLELEGENQLVPIEQESGSSEADNSKTTKGLTDADAQGADFYDSLSVLDKAGAASTRTVISFGAGEETKKVELTVKADDLVEYSESFLLGIVSSTANQYLLQHAEGIPDIPLKQGRDIALTSITIGDASGEEPECIVQAEKTKYALEKGQDKVSVSFTREGALDTFSTVMVYREGKAYGYFHFAPYQEIQIAELEAGSYEIQGKQNCRIFGSREIEVRGGTAVEEKKTDAKKLSEVADPVGDLDTIYEYDALPDNDQAEDSQKVSTQEPGKKAVPKEVSGKKGASTYANGNPSWFPEWANIPEYTDTTDYKAYVKVQGTSLYKEVSVSNSHYHSYEYINKKDRTHNGQSIYNTWRMNTSGFLSSCYNNVCKSEIPHYYALTGIESVETRYYVDDTKLNVTLAVEGVGAKQVDYIKSKDTDGLPKGVHDIKVMIPGDETRAGKISIKNDNSGSHDGADVYFMNAFRMNKRTYQVKVDNSNKLSYVTKSGDTEQVAAQSVSADQYSYVKMGNGSESKVSINLSMYDNYPMRVTGYQLLDKYGSVIANTHRGTYGSDQFQFNDTFLNNNAKYSFQAKRENTNESYYTYWIQPVVEKIAVKNFKIQNGSKDSIYNPYRGELVLENKDRNLYQGDYAVLSAKDVQEDYKFSGVYIKRRKAESADWQSMIYYADQSGKVAFHLDADFSDYQLEPIFEGHEADTVTVSIAEDARGHGSITAKDNKGNDSSAEAAKKEDNDQEVSSLILVNSGEYQINSYVPLVAKPEEGYVTCWHSGSRTYYGNTFYYQMDGNSNHNAIVVDFVKKDDLATAKVNLNLSVYENQVNLRNSSAAADLVPLKDMQYATTTAQTYQGTTDSSGNTNIKDFEGVIGGTYSMMLYQPGESRYRYVEYEFTGKTSYGINVPAFAGMSAYPDRVTARIDGTSSNQSYIDLTNNGEVEVTVEVYRPDKDTSLGEVGLSFYYEGNDGMTKQNYTIEKPDQDSGEEAGLGLYDTYTLKVPASEIPDMSYLYVDVKSSYEVLETGKDGEDGQTIRIDCDTGYVNTGYKFKTPNESSELAIQEEVPELPGLESAGENNIEIPFIGSLDFGFSAKNGAYFARQNDPNTGVFYLLAGYNVVSTWPKTLTDRYTGASKTAEALITAEEQSRAVGDLNGGGSSLVTIPGSTVVNIAPAVSLKFVMKPQEDGGYQILGYDAVLGMDELITYNAPFSIYGVPCYVNLTFNGEEFLEVHGGGDNFEKNGIQDSILKPGSGVDVAYFIQAPNLDITVKTGVGFNAFAGVYLSLGGNLKFNLEHTDSWKAGGYFYIKGGVGADLAVFSLEETVSLPKGDKQEFGDDEARSHIHSATTTLSDVSPVSGKGTTEMMKSLNKQIEATDQNPKFSVSRDAGQSSLDPVEHGSLNEVLKPAGKNVKMQLQKLAGNKLMAITLADNGAAEESLNYLSAVYAISEDGGKTWNRKMNISDSDKLQWDVRYYKLNDKLLMTWSEGDLDAAVGEGLNAKSEFDLAAVAKALTAFDLKGRYFDLDGNPLGDSFAITSNENVAASSLDAVENADGTVDLYYERRGYQKDAVTMTELVTQEQTVCKAVLDDQGRTAAEDVRVLVTDKTGNKNYRITELEAFSHKGIKGQILVLDRDGKLTQETADRTEASIDDRQIYLRVVSDENGNIPDGTLVPLTGTETCAQHISLITNEEHIYLFWNQDGSIVSMNDFLPTTQEDYTEWEACSASENFGSRLLVADEDSLTDNTDFRTAMTTDGKGILLWKSSEGRQYSDDKLGNQICAAIFATDDMGAVVSSGETVSLSSLVKEIGNLDVQMLDDGQIIYGFTRLDGETMYESSSADAFVEDTEGLHDVRIAEADSEDYPVSGEEYTSYVTLWNNGLTEEKDLTLSASGALNGTAALAELIGEQNGTLTEGEESLASGQAKKLMLPVTAADSIQDGDEVVYTISQNGVELSRFTDTVHKGAYMVPQEMAEVVSIPGTDDYQISMTVMNMGNQEGTTDVHSYTYDQGVQAEKNSDTAECDYQDETVLNPGDTTVISYIMKGAAHTDDGIHMIGIQTGDGYGQAVEGMLPERIEAMEGSGEQPEEPKQPEQPSNPSNPGVSQPGSSQQPGSTAQTTVPKKGDILTLGSKTTQAQYKVTSSKVVTYYKVKVPAGTTSAKVPDTIKISGKTYQVSAIASDAFRGNKKLKKITIGKNITKIPSKAFYNNKKLVTLQILSKKINKIGSSAFSGCSKLKTFTLESTKLKKKAVQNSLKGSSIQSIKTTAALRKKYKKYFTKKNSGRKVKIK